MSTCCYTSWNGWSGMDLTEYSHYDGMGLGDLVRAKQTDARELQALFREAVAKVNPYINAVIETYDMGERDTNVNPSALFAGVPFLMKDLGATEAGSRQECGSRLVKGFVSDAESYLTARFKQVGLIILGRTTTPEFGQSCTTESILNGETRNPWNPKVMVGGSSGGAAACVAAGIVPLAGASDGGGSIRIPASACGIVGLKPSRGRVTMGPNAGEGYGGFVQDFAVTQSIRDTAALLDAVSKPAPGDPFIIVQPSRPFSQEVNAPTGRLRIAWTTHPWQPDTTLNHDVIQCVEEIAYECEAMGYEMKETTPIFNYENYFKAMLSFWTFGFDSMLDKLARKMNRNISDETLEPITLSEYYYAKNIGAADVAAADDVFNNLRRTFGKFFQNYDLLLTPTLAQLPEPLGKYAQSRNDLDFVTWCRLCEETTMYMAMANLTGQPAISLPLGQSKSGLPIGAQFMARFGEEATLIRLASAFEKDHPWRDRIPPIHASLQLPKRD
jgi:amidase